MTKITHVLITTCTAALLGLQFQTTPILAFRKTSNVDEFMVKNQRMRQNYFLQSALNNELDTNKIGVTYDDLPNLSVDSEELPALIVDYANMIRNDIILLDNSVETRTRKRGNIVKNYNKYGPINEVPCMCDLEKVPKFLGENFFPSSLETRKCNDTLCPAPYKCHRREHYVSVLQRKQATGTEPSDDVPDDIAKNWVAVQEKVVVGCFCLKNYSDRD